MIHSMYLRINSIYLCTECHVCDVSCPLTVYFCYLLRFIIVSSVHKAFSVSSNVHAQNIGTHKVLLRKSK